MRDWIDAIDKDPKGKNVPIALLATKGDLEHDRQVNLQSGYVLREDIGESRCLLFRETTTYGNDVKPIQDLFETLILDILHRKAN